MNKEKLIKSIIYITGSISLFFFILSRFPVFPVTFEDTELLKEEESGIYGDMYYQCMVDDFKILLPEYYPTFINSGKLVNIDSADILVFGDSFMRMTRVEKNFIQKLNDTLKLKVFYTQEPFVFNLLGKSNFKTDRKRILLFELVERHIYDVFSKKHVLKDSKRKLFLELFDYFVPESRELKYQFMLQKSIFSSKVYQAVINFRFDIFKVISDMTPVYKKDPPWLFLYKDVNPKYTSFYRKFSEKDIEMAADNIADLSRKMKEMYNFEFVFFPIPNKYTFYNKVINNDIYKGFIPSLLKELIKRNVMVVNIYDSFIEYDGLLYYPTDSHWNPEGNRLAFKIFSDQMKSYGFTF